MTKRSLADRRLIAEHFQYGGKKFACLKRQGSSKRGKCHLTEISADFLFVQASRNIRFCDGETFRSQLAIQHLNEDRPCGHKPKALCPNDERKVMRRPHITELTAEDFGISVATVKRIGSALGGMMSCRRQVHILPVHAAKRVSYATQQLGQDNSRKCWADYKSC